MTKRKPTHPGVVLLEDVIKPLGLTITEAAKMLGVSRKALSEYGNDESDVAVQQHRTPHCGKRTKTSPEKAG